MLLKRYLFREIAATFLAVILVVLLIAMSNKLVRLVAQAATGDISPTVLFQVILFQLPEMLAFLLPIAFFIAVLLCLSRFFADNEIPVMLACGVSWKNLLSICLGLGLIVMSASGVLTCYFGPKLAQFREQLLQKEGLMLLVQTVSPGRFHSFHKDRLVFYVADLNPDHSELKRVFIAEHPKGDGRDHAEWSVVTAEKGNVVSDEKTGNKYFKLTDGRRYNGLPGQSDYTILKFGQYQRLLDAPPKQHGLYFHRTMPTKMLIHDKTLGNMAELQWRLSVPLSALLLAILALPLSQVSPRAGRYSRLFTAIIVCIIYYNLLTVSKRAIATGSLPAYIGVWWVHLLFLGVGLCLLAKTSGRWHQGIQAIKRVFRAKGIFYPQQMRSSVKGNHE